MKEKFTTYRSIIDTARIFENTATLLQCELPQTFAAYHAAADKTAEILQANGIGPVERISLPADGKTAYQDKIMPIGWDATCGKVTVLSGSGFKSGTVVADYQTHPFHLIKGSTGTAPGGEELRLITFEQLLSGMNALDALVMIQDGVGPGCPDLKRILDLGARGIISDYAMNADTHPDGLQWNNAVTERSSWHATLEERPFLAFAVTPRVGRKLRAAASRGQVLLKVECDAHRHEDTVDVVTALIPGRRKEEFWMVAHLYEPLSNDNSGGVASVIEAARILQAQGQPEFSVRLLFGLEYYGFAAYAALRGNKNLSAEVIGACNFDAMLLHNGWTLSLHAAQPATPFYGNYLLRMLYDDLKTIPGLPNIEYANSFSCMYDDDTFLGDSTIGIPTVWPIRCGTAETPALWHNSGQTMDYMDEEATRFAVAVNLTFIDAVVNLDIDKLERTSDVFTGALEAELSRSVGSQKEHLTRRYEILAQDLENFSRVFPDKSVGIMRSQLEDTYQKLCIGLPDECPHSAWRDFAESIVPRRLTAGFPFNLANAPENARKPLPGSVLYCPLAAILANMDGMRNLAQIFRMVEHETCALIPENSIFQYLQTLYKLERYGYVRLDGIRKISKEEIVKALRDVGVKEGDFLIVHAGPTRLGYIDGGEKTIIEAFQEVLGPSGTFLCAVLGYTFPFIGVPNQLRLFKPFQEDDVDCIWTGSLPRYLLRAGAPRSRHYTHRWTGYGAEAEIACRDHRPTDPPLGERSPLAYALKRGGKILHFGSEVSSTTFLHYIEDELSLPGIEDVLVQVRLANGSCSTVAVPRNLPGCRDFYHGNEDTIRFFQEASKRGLQIHATTLGLGKIRLMDMRELHDIGVEIAKEDPFIFLCPEEKHCHSCDYLRKQYLGLSMRIAIREYQA